MKNFNFLTKIGNFEIFYQKFKILKFFCKPLTFFCQKFKIGNIKIFCHELKALKFFCQKWVTFKLFIENLKLNFPFKNWKFWIFLLENGN